MGNYVYIQTQAAVDGFEAMWTVGFYKPDGQFEPSSDHHTEGEAIQRVHWLNGGAGAGAIVQVQQHVAELQKNVDSFQSQLSAALPPWTTPAPFPNIVFLPSGRLINLDQMTTASLVDSAITVDFSDDQGTRWLRNDDKDALLNYLNRFAPHVLPSGLTADERIAESDIDLEVERRR